MQENKSRLTVFYDGTFWIGIYERISKNELEACKITFGAEPKDYEVYEFLLQNWAGLKFSPPVSAGEKQEKKINPKRMKRLVKKELDSHGTGTKSQQALQLQREENKMVRSRKSREQKEEEKERHFELKQQKRKEKHRGR
ncbi:YjdF family protein [[Clostridium] symbiosum]|uniref:YjdF family protein n=1 Tax=Clostridium symbiosum TaxID=1512 RepID=UPI001D07F0DC|nr:YjdF family protein [[Clostridium] symbiosum]MCB6611190.1 YjdF family protein [[Clostridium] symbiosum]MCB6933307.1 YjdF family protein [[Clostridium] symbiosum]